MFSMFAPHHPLLVDAMLSEMVRCPSFTAPTASSGSPRLTEHETDYVLTLAAPGVKPSDVKVSGSSEGELKVSGESSVSGRFAWSIRLPRDAHLEVATANHVDGLLTVTIPKKQPEVTRIEFREAEEETTSKEKDGKPRAYSLTFNAAGLAQADLELTVEDGVLKVRGETARTGARIGKQLRLPENADAASAHATHIDGILTVTIPKKVPPATPALNIKVNQSADEATKTDEVAPVVASTPEDEEKQSGDAEMATAEAEDDAVMV